jgi:excisionase family DNA binding protein
MRKNPMAALIPEKFETVAPSEADALLARESSRRLAARKLGQQTSICIQVQDDGEQAETITVPASALRLFLHLLTEMSQGHTVALVPTHTELTTQQAADLLNISRPYMAKLLDEGKIPGRTVGKYRRVRFDDLMNFKRKDDDARAKILDQLTAEAQEVGMGY